MNPGPIRNISLHVSIWDTGRNLGKRGRIKERSDFLCSAAAAWKDGAAGKIWPVCGNAVKIGIDAGKNVIGYTRSQSGDSIHLPAAQNFTAEEAEALCARNRPDVGSEEDLGDIVVGPRVIPLQISLV